MPYFISNDNPDCTGWAVEKEDGEVIGCHERRSDAIDQMVALSIAEDVEPGGERSKAFPDLTPPQPVRDEARRGLEWRREHNRGGTAVGVARARDLANGRTLSIETINRMISYFARHEIDKQGQGWSPGEEGYPSAGRIAWALWGGDPGQSWATRMRSEWEAESEKAGPVSTSQPRGIMNIKRINTSASFEVKAASTEAPHGEVTAIVSVFGNKDLVNDRVVRGAFANTLAEIEKSGKAVPFIWSHQWDSPESYIGAITHAKETDEGLEVRAALFDTPTAQHVRTLLASRLVSEFSFAYDIVKQAPGKDGVNELLELTLIEAGPTLRGANNQTRLIGVRSATAAQPSKAEPGELQEGSFVEWEGNYGRVEYIMTEGTFGVEGDPLSLTATPEDPLALVRLYEEGEEGAEQYMPTDIFAAYRFSQLTATEEKAEPAGLETPPAVGTGEKAGRVLSSKNETRIKDAVSLLNEVIGSLPADDNSKSEEPLVKDEVIVGTEGASQPMDAATAQLLLDLETETE